MRYKVLLFLPVGFIKGIYEAAKVGAKYFYLNFKHRQVKFYYGSDALGNCKFENDITLLHGAVISNTSIGRKSYVGQKSYLKNCNIGRYCSIAPGVHAGLGIHPIGKNASTSVAFYRKKAAIPTYVSENKFLEEFKQIIIGNDVWIGERAIIMDGVTIGDGAVVGAGAVVTKDVEPYEIVAGVPAKKIRDRFSVETKENLMHIKWWNIDEDWIKENSTKFEDVDALIMSLK